MLRTSITQGNFARCRSVADFNFLIAKVAGFHENPPLFVSLRGGRICARRGNLWRNETASRSEARQGRAMINSRAPTGARLFNTDSWLKYWIKNPVRLHDLIHKSVPPFHAQQEILFQIPYSSRNKGQDTDKMEGIAQYFIPVLQSIRYSLESVLSKSRSKQSSVLHTFVSVFSYCSTSL